MYEIVFKVALHIGPLTSLCAKQRNYLFKLFSPPAIYWLFHYYERNTTLIVMLPRIITPTPAYIFCMD